MSALNEERTVVQLVAIDETGDSYYRMRWPGAQLAEQAPNWRVISLQADAKERLLWGEKADLLVIYQCQDLDLHPLIQARVKAGKKTLAEYNDNFYEPPPSSPVFEPWTSPIVWQSYESFIRVCDGVIVTGEGLHQLLQPLAASKLCILENHFPDELPPFEEIWRPPGENLVLGWAGSVGHISDIYAAIPSLRELMVEIPNLKFHVMGNDAIPPALGLPPEKFTFTDWGSIRDYYEFWKPVDIGFAPLLDTGYNRCRSDVKAVEMAACSALPILTNATPYRKFIEATSVPSYSSFTELKDLIRSYARDHSKLKEDLKRAYDYVRDQRIGIRRKERLDYFLSMMPEKKDSFSWPMPTGYHEVMGTPSEKTESAATLEKALRFRSQKKNPELLRLCQNELKRNPMNFEVALLELHALRSLKDESVISKTHSYIQNFPGDYRFELFQLTLPQSNAERLSKWNAFLTKLSKTSEYYRNFLMAIVVKIFCDQAVKLRDLLSLGTLMVETFPNSAALRMTLAQLYEQAGDQVRAMEHFRWLVEAKQIVSPNIEFFKASSYPFIKAWEETIEARLQDGRVAGKKE